MVSDERGVSFSFWMGLRGASLLWALHIYQGFRKSGGLDQSFDLYVPVYKSLNLLLAAQNEKEKEVKKEVAGLPTTPKKIPNIYILHAKV